MDSVWNLFSENCGWALYGMQTNSKQYVVIAARNVATVSMSRGAEPRSFYPVDSLLSVNVPGETRTMLNQEIIGDCEFAYGASYDEALKTLFARWDSETPSVKPASADVMHLSFSDG